MKTINKKSTLIAQYQGFKIYEDHVYGDEANLILTKNNIIIAQDQREVSDYMSMIDEGKY